MQRSDTSTKLRRTIDTEELSVSEARSIRALVERGGRRIARTLDHELGNLGISPGVRARLVPAHLDALLAIGSPSVIDKASYVGGIYAEAGFKVDIVIAGHKLMLMAIGTSVGLGTKLLFGLRTVFAMHKVAGLLITTAVQAHNDHSTLAVVEDLRGIADRIELEAKVSSQSVANQSNAISDAVRALASELASVSSRTDNATREADDVRGSVQSCAAAVEELTASIDEINRQVVESQQMSSEALMKAQAINEISGKLSQSASRIGDIVKLISDIAGQTNLLALNATIEAARAGEAGKGFAVVASEVKNLANQTSRATENVAAQVEEIQLIAEQTTQSAASVGDIIGRNAVIASSVAMAVSEQGRATREISNNVLRAARGTASVAEAVDLIARDSATMRQRADQVCAGVVTVSADMQELDTTLDDLTASLRNNRTLDRRSAERWRIEPPARMDVHFEGRILQGEVLNISTGGLALRLESDLPERAQVKLLAPGRSESLVGIVLEGGRALCRVRVEDSDAALRLMHHLSQARAA